MAGFAALASGMLVAWSAGSADAAQLRASRKVAGFPSSTSAFHLPNGTAPPNATMISGANHPHPFVSFYDSHETGLGIWKWSNALAVYDRFVAPLAGQPIKLAEVGVQSGGSLQMWRHVLGAECHLYGIDINPAALKFADPMTTITLGDQGNSSMWRSFFTDTTKAPLDVLIDDGGHQWNQMLITLIAGFDNAAPGGIVVIEDIHGDYYTDYFFVPAARHFAQSAEAGNLASVHVFPFLLVAKRAGEDRAPLLFEGSTETVSDFEALYAAIPRHWGGHVVLENADYGSFFTEQGLVTIFKAFRGLQHAAWSDSPEGCQHTNAANCRVNAHLSDMQSVITGVHVYPSRLVVEVAAASVTVDAVRRGTEWLPY